MNAENALNLLDVRGQLHNSAVDYIIQNESSLDWTDLNSLQSSLNIIIKNFAFDNNLYTEDGINSQNVDNLLSQVYQNLNMSIAQVAVNVNVSEVALQYYKDLENLMTEAETQGLEWLIDSVKSLERQIQSSIDSQQLDGNSVEVKVLWSSTSTLRYSTYYWWNQSEVIGITSSWLRLKPGSQNEPPPQGLYLGFITSDVSSCIWGGIYGNGPGVVAGACGGSATDIIIHYYF